MHSTLALSARRGAERWLGFLGKAFSVWSTITTLADIAERHLAPRWFEWLERTTGFRFKGTRERIPRFSAGSYTIIARGAIRGTWRRYSSPVDDSYIVNPYQQRVTLVFQSPVTLVGYRLGGEYFPLGGGEALVSEDTSWVYLVFSDGQMAEFQLNKTINPYALGPFYGYVWLQATFEIEIYTRTAEDEGFKEQSYQPDQPLRLSPKLPVKTLVVPKPAKPSLRGAVVVPKTLPASIPAKPYRPTKVVTKELALTRPTLITKVPEFLQSPEVAPELEPIRDLLERILDKECPPQCPPCEPRKPSGKQQGDSGNFPTVLLFWVEEDNEGRISLEQQLFTVDLPQSVVANIERTAKKAYKLWGTEPVTAAAADDGAPWKPPIGPHLKVIWVPEDRGTQGYYYFRVPHWGLNLQQTLALDWGSLRWLKGLRNQLKIDFHDGRTFSLFGDQFDNLSRIWEFCRQGIAPPVGYKETRIERGESLTTLSLRVRKLEFWVTRAGHPSWWSWWPPL